MKNLGRRGKILLGAGVVLVLLLAMGGGAALVAPDLVARLTGRMFGTAYVSGIETQFMAIDQERGGQPLGFVFAQDAQGQYMGEDASLANHYQGIQRKDYDGTPYFFLTRHQENAPGELLVVKMGSKMNVTGPLGTNYDTRTGYPSSLDQTVKSYHFDGQNGWPNCPHPGAGQIVENVLVVPLEQACPRGLVLLDVTNPQDIRPTKVITTYTQNGATVNLPDDMSGVVGAIQPSAGGEGKVLFAFTRDPFEANDALRFLESNSATLDAETTLSYVAAWNADQLENGADRIRCRCGRFRCGRDCAAFTIDWQAVNFMRDAAGGLYLIGLGSDYDRVGRDYARLFQVTRLTDHVALRYVGQRQVLSDHPEMGTWEAGGGVFVSPAGQVSLYMTAPDNVGPSVNGRRTIQAGEWSQ